MLVTHLAIKALAIVMSMSHTARQPEISDPLPPPPPPPPAGEVRVIDYRTEHDGRTYAWSVMIPPGAKERGPGLLFLHGCGECGDDGKKNLSVGLPPAVRKNPEHWPMVIIVPQKPVFNSEWEDHQAAVLAILDLAAEKGHYDPKRLAITGLSQGGHGTIWFAANHRDRFKAAVPVCGYIDRRFDDNNVRIAGPGATSSDQSVVAMAEKLAGLPIWLFHGEKDDVIPPTESRSLYKALGGRVDGEFPPPGHLRYIEFPDTNHNSWDDTYSESSLGSWILQYTR